MAKIYDITQDGFKVAQARGKNDAIKKVEKIIAWNGFVRPKWGKFSHGIMTITSGENIFTIEENKGDK